MPHPKPGPGALDFFQSLEAHLNSHLPDPVAMRKVIAEVVERAKSDKNSPHKRFPEGAFLNHYVAPCIHDFLQRKLGLAADSARLAFLSESFRSIPDVASGSPTRSEKHPFTKLLGTSADKVVKIWKGQSNISPVTQSCPDMALRPPCPYTVVIEGKYFQQGGVYAAERALVKDIYQAFFYLGLARLPATATHPAWDYQYSCFLAYDATEEGSLLNAWLSLAPAVRHACWQGANIYVMILRGTSA
jgi:hypothetical protein